ncbi:prohibitin family protein [Helicobacter sp. MIT 01-3238]|uniref:prohibitin family protein n=1 Tax=Helicobacter sp. MIT 01-3238 TaxID=398627 RepID=UPI000E1F2AD1|nr:prohibitin family protein [Helicobacter sp. MIT 01-3238]RDU53781.1 hypothetical protein CQA40_04290 [Helicobacter sp. MIT 01-3238]
MPIDLNEHLKRKNANNGSNQNNENPQNRGNGSNNDRNNQDNDKNKSPFPPNFNPNFNLPPNLLSSRFVTYAIVGVIAVLLFVMARPFVVVNSGETGIKVTMGAYDYDHPMKPGLHFFVPIFQDVIIIDTKVRTLNFSSTEDMGNVGKNQSILRNGAINVMDTSGMTISIELTVQYRLDEAKVPFTIANYGTAWEQKLINPVIRDIVRSAVGKYPTEELPTKRDEVASLIYNGFKNSIDSVPNQPVKLESIQLREIVLPEEVKSRIEGVELAKRDAQKAKEEANALRERAKGKADSLEIEAKGQSQANRLVNDSLSQRLLELRQIEMQGKFNEALKENKDAQIFLTPGGAVPNIWVDSKSKQQNTVISK